MVSELPPKQVKVKTTESPNIKPVNFKNNPGGGPGPTGTGGGGPTSHFTSAGGKSIPPSGQSDANRTTNAKGSDYNSRPNNGAPPNRQAALNDVMIDGGNLKLGGLSTIVPTKRAQ